MTKDLRRINKMGIYNRDIKESNYKGGLLIDFSSAMTMPHYIFQTRPQWQVDRIKRLDLLDFDEMVKVSNIKTWERATRNREYLQKLRPRPAEVQSFGG